MRTSGYMRRWLAEAGAALAVVAALAAPAAAEGGPFGLGLILGEPTGLSAKLFLDKRHAVDAALDFSLVDDRLEVHADYLFHFTPVLRGELPRGHLLIPYVGIGGFIGVWERDRDKDDDAVLGVRIPVGLAWIPKGAPIDVFLELAPGISLLPETDPDIGAGLGVRWFF